MNKYNAYTLWVKYRNTGWIAVLTAKATSHRYGWSPYSHLNHYAKMVYKGLSYYRRGKEWMIKPEGIKPAELIREEKASDRAS